MFSSEHTLPPSTDSETSNVIDSELVRSAAIDRALHRLEPEIARLARDQHRLAEHQALIREGRCRWCGHPLRSLDSLRQGAGKLCAALHRR